MNIQIRHIGKYNEERALFEVINNTKTSQPVPLMPPQLTPVGTGGAYLQAELQWYLEEYLELPVGSFQVRAEKLRKALSQWGMSCFNSLFGKDKTRDWYRDARQKGLANLRLTIKSDDPEILSWPWEALESGEDGLLAMQCRIERKLDEVGDVIPVSEALPQEELNILYIIARPDGDADVDFQSLARPLIDYVNKEGWPVHIDVLRPPTFDRLREVLAEKNYHIVHFDGHGGFGKLPTSEPSGVLVFEKNSTNYSADLIPANMLGELLRVHNIPLMVLNACKSAEMDKSAFSSVAASLLKAGIHSVVAMSHNLYVNGAKEFVPAFYRKLFQAGDIAAAICDGRCEMFRHQMRDSFIGKIVFHDWMVPVLYQQEDGFLPGLTAGAFRKSALPAETHDLGDYGFIGRGRNIRQLEHALRGKQPSILIHGMAGEGKTTLAKGFLRWLEDTGGLGAGAFWFSFEDIHNADFIIDTLTDRLLGTQAMAWSAEQKLDAVTQTLRKHQFVIVWDNFESASGIPGTEVSALLKDDDRLKLKNFLRELRGGKTKIIITSRSPENWLTLPECFRLPLSGLAGEELWQYCNAVVEDLGLVIDRENETYRKLLEKLEGNPLAIRVILLRLSERPAERLLEELEADFKGLEGDEGAQKIMSVLSVFGRGLDRAWSPALRLIGLHEHFVSVGLLWYMLESTEANVELKVCFAALESAGLCRSAGDNIYKLHPALRGCLIRLHPAEEAEQRVFVEVMGGLAHEYTAKQLHEQRDVFRLFGANFYRALELARELDMRDDFLILLFGLGLYAKNIRNFSEAERIYIQCAETAKKYNNENFLVMTYHQLGIIAQERSDLISAVEWYQQALVIKLKQGNEHDVASIYHQLGRVAEERRDFDSAEDYYQQALAINLEQGNESGAAGAYHQLGMVAQKQRDFDSAIDWYQKSLAIKLKQGNEQGAASTYHQLGMVAEEQGNFESAEDWYKQSLAISLKRGIEHGAARTYHQLGIVAQKRQHFDAAEDWYKQSLAILLKQGNEHGAAMTYHQLGMVAQERRDFGSAEGWYKQSLAIKLKQGNEHGASITYHQLGNVAQERGDFGSAEGWYQQSLAIKLKQGNEHGAAISYHQLGMIAEEQGDFGSAEDYYRQAFEIFKRSNDEYSTNIVIESLNRLNDARNDEGM